MKYSSTERKTLKAKGIREVAAEGKAKIREQALSLKRSAFSVPR
jgi:hypothetical protein